MKALFDVTSRLTRGEKRDIDVAAGEREKASQEVESTSSLLAHATHIPITPQQFVPVQMAGVGTQVPRTPRAPSSDPGKQEQMLEVIRELC